MEVKFYKQLQQLVTSLQKNLECSVCLELLTDPVQTTCGHHFCRKCVLKVLQTKRTALCPLCKKLMSKRGLRESNKLLTLIVGTQQIMQAVEADTQSSAIAVSVSSQSQALSRKRTSRQLEISVSGCSIQVNTSKKQKTTTDEVKEDAVMRTEAASVPVPPLKKADFHKDSWKWGLSDISSPSTLGLSKKSYLQDAQCRADADDKLAKYIVCENLGEKSSEVAVLSRVYNSDEQNSVSTIQLSKLMSKQEDNLHGGREEPTDKKSDTMAHTHESFIQYYSKFAASTQAEPEPLGVPREQWVRNPKSLVKQTVKPGENDCEVSVDSGLPKSTDSLITISSQEKVQNWLQNLTKEPEGDRCFSSTSNNNILDAAAAPMLESIDDNTFPQTQETLVLTDDECRKVETGAKTTDDDMSLHCDANVDVSNTTLSSVSGDEFNFKQSMVTDHISPISKEHCSARIPRNQLPFSETNTHTVHDDPYKYIPSQEVITNKKSVRRRNKENLMSNKSVVKNICKSKSRKLPADCSTFDLLFESANQDGYDASSEDDLLLNLFVTPQGNNLSHVNKRQSARRYTRKKKSVSPAAHSTQMSLKLGNDATNVEPKGSRKRGRSTKNLPTASQSEHEINSIVAKLSEAENHTLTVVDERQSRPGIVVKALSHSVRTGEVIPDQVMNLTTKESQEIVQDCDHPSSLVCSDKTIPPNSNLTKPGKECGLSKECSEVRDEKVETDTIEPKDVLSTKENISRVSSQNLFIPATVENEPTGLLKRPKVDVNVGGENVESKSEMLHDTACKSVGNTNNAKENNNLCSVNSSFSEGRHSFDPDVTSKKSAADKQSKLTVHSTTCKNAFSNAAFAVDQSKQCNVSVSLNANIAQCSMIQSDSKSAKSSRPKINRICSSTISAMSGTRDIRSQPVEMDVLSSTDFIADTYDVLNPFKFTAVYAKELTKPIADTNTPENSKALCRSKPYMSNSCDPSLNKNEQISSSIDCIAAAGDSSPQQRPVLLSRNPSAEPVQDNEQVEAPNTDIEMQHGCGEMATSTEFLKDSPTAKDCFSRVATQSSALQDGVLRPNILMKLKENSHKLKTCAKASERDIEERNECSTSVNKISDKAPSEVFNKSMHREKFYQVYPTDLKSPGWSHTMQMSKDFHIKPKPVQLHIEEKLVKKIVGKQSLPDLLENKVITDVPLSIDTAYSADDLDTHSKLLKPTLLLTTDHDVTIKEKSEVASKDEARLCHGISDKGKDNNYADIPEKIVVEMSKSLNIESAKVGARCVTQKGGPDSSVHPIRYPVRKTFALDVDTQELEFMEKPSSTLEMNCYFNEAFASKVSSMSPLLQKVDNCGALSADTDEWISPSRPKHSNSKVCSIIKHSASEKVDACPLSVAISSKACEGSKPIGIKLSQDTMSHFYESNNIPHKMQDSSSSTLVPTGMKMASSAVLCSHQPDSTHINALSDKAHVSTNLCKIDCLEISGAYCTKFYQLGKLRNYVRHFHSIATQTDYIEKEQVLCHLCKNFEKTKMEELTIPNDVAVVSSKSGELKKTSMYSSEVQPVEISSKDSTQSKNITRPTDSAGPTCTVKWPVQDYVGIDFHECSTGKRLVQTDQEQYKLQDSSNSGNKKSITIVSPVTSKKCLVHDVAHVRTSNPCSQDSQKYGLNKVAHEGNAKQIILVGSSPIMSKPCVEDVMKVDVEPAVHHIIGTSCSLVVDRSQDSAKRSFVEKYSHNNSAETFQHSLVHSSTRPLIVDGNSIDSTSAFYLQNMSQLPEKKGACSLHAGLVLENGHNLDAASNCVTESHSQYHVNKLQECDCSQDSIKHSCFQKSFINASKDDSSVAFVSQDAVIHSTRDITCNKLQSRVKCPLTDMSCFQLSRRSFHEDHVRDSGRYASDTCRSQGRYASDTVARTSNNANCLHKAAPSLNCNQSLGSQTDAFEDSSSLDSDAEWNSSTVLTNSASQNRPKSTLIDGYSQQFDLDFPQNRCSRDSTGSLPHSSINHATVNHQPLVQAQQNIDERHHVTSSHSMEDAMPAFVDSENMLSNKLMNNNSFAFSTLIGGSIDTPKLLTPMKDFTASYQKSQNSSTTEHPAFVTVNCSLSPKESVQQGNATEQSDSEDSKGSTSYSVLQEPNTSQQSYQSKIESHLEAPVGGNKAIASKIGIDSSDSDNSIKKQRISQKTNLRSYYLSRRPSPETVVVNKEPKVSNAHHSDTSSPSSKQRNSCRKTKRGIANRLSPINFDNIVMSPYKPNTLDAKISESNYRSTADGNDELVDLEADFVPPTPPVGWSAANKVEKKAKTRSPGIDSESNVTFGSNSKSLRCKDISDSKRARCHSLPDLLQVSKPLKKSRFKRIQRLYDSDSSSSDSNIEKFRPLDVRNRNKLHSSGSPSQKDNEGKKEPCATPIEMLNSSSRDVILSESISMLRELDNVPAKLLGQPPHAENKLFKHGSKDICEDHNLSSPVETRVTDETDEKVLAPDTECIEAINLDSDTEELTRTEHLNSKECMERVLANISKDLNLVNPKRKLREEITSEVNTISESLQTQDFSENADHVQLKANRRKFRSQALLPATEETTVTYQNTSRFQHGNLKMKPETSSFCENDRMRSQVGSDDLYSSSNAESDESSASSSYKVLNTQQRASLMTDVQHMRAMIHALEAKLKQKECPTPASKFKTPSKMKRSNSNTATTQSGRTWPIFAEKEKSRIQQDRHNSVASSQKSVEGASAHTTSRQTTSGGRRLSGQSSASGGSSISKQSPLILGSSSIHRSKIGTTPQRRKLDGSARSFSPVAVSEIIGSNVQQMEERRSCEMPAAVNVSSTPKQVSKEQLNLIRRGLDFTKTLNGCLSLVTTKLQDSETLKVQEFANKVGATCCRTFNKNTTHVIVKTGPDLKCERTLKYFQGIAGKKWVVSYIWVKNSLEQGQLLHEENYEVIGDTYSGTFHGPKLARTSQDKFLSGYEICCLGPFPDITRDQFSELVELCGATLVFQPSMFPYNPNKTQIIVFQKLPHSPINYNELLQRYQAVSIHRDWLLDSIVRYSALPFKDYMLSDPLPTSCRS